MICWLLKSCWEVTATEKPFQFLLLKTSISDSNLWISSDQITAGFFSLSLSIYVCVFFNQTTNICLLISSWQWRRELQPSIELFCSWLNLRRSFTRFDLIELYDDCFFIRVNKWRRTLSFSSFIVHIGACTWRLSRAFTWCVLSVVLKAKVNNLVHCDSPEKAKWNSFLSWNKRTHMRRIARCCLLSLSLVEKVLNSFLNVIMIIRHSSKG